MAKHVKQFRYYKEKDSERNYPAWLSFRNLVSGSAFNEYNRIVQLGIQSLPGTKFYLNNGQNPVIIGNTGIYELDLEGDTEITALSFDAKSIQAIMSNVNAYLIVDFIYEKLEEEES